MNSSRLCSQPSTFNPLQKVNIYNTLKWLGCLVLLLISSVAQAQTPHGTIKGKVVTSDGQPGEFVNVALKGTSKGTHVNANGMYTINNINPGTYTLVASYIGLNTQNQTVEVKAGETIEVNFTLTENNQQLQEVVVTSGKKINKFSRQQSDDVAKLPLKNLENPQVYNVVTSELLKDQLNVNISQALSNVPGAVPSIDPAGGTSITLRGFTAEIAARNGIQFIAAGRSSVDPVNVDHFEVLKGPSATLFGNTVSSYGGAINMVTKKPTAETKGEITYSAGSWGLNRVTADINTPLNQEKTALFRVNAAVNKQQSYLVNGHNNTFTIDPSLLYKVNDRLTLSADLEIYHEDLTRVPYMRYTGLNITNINQNPLDYRTSLYSDGINAVTNTFRSYFEAKYKINDSWTSQTNISVNNEKVAKSYQAYPTFISPTLIERGISLFGPITTINTDIQHNLKGDFKIGKIRNRLVWGLDYIHTKSDFTYASATIDTIDITKSYGPVTQPLADKAIQNGFTGLYPSEFNQYATYASDLVNITDRLMTLVSLRVDRYQLKGNGGYSQTSLTPKLGLIYQPVKDQVSIFGNYMSGFTNNGPIVQPDGTRVVLKPEHAFQWEGGVKVSTANNRLSATVSYYNIDVRDALRYDNSNFTYQDGKQKSQGAEVSIVANPVEGVNLLAGYVYNKNQYIRATSGEGKDVTGTPRNVANFWGSYKFQPGTILQDFGFGVGGNYAQKSYYDLDNIIVIPSFVLVNATVFYEQPKWRLGIAANNTGNKKYWSPSFTANPQPLRQLIASASFKF
ncbi:TonB-dependent receptor [Mucilaginibacter rubeus]|uniref:TonB-dependent receptor n=1 Tax=Mucilaginibacter rubeus TaxID=2027860 RepID=A0A5C1I1U6_9SPHI|nr:TonB-dependent receptor [Mucilaginibacter rubeus]QEM11181.1 TonB-dependent receptor [Mucilaginibacter rubeus]